MPGKIASLPAAIREQLNRRLEDTEPGPALLEWVNSLPEVQAVMARDFGGEPISQQNLAAWKKHGHRKWRLLQSAREFVSDLDADEAASEKALTTALSEKLGQWGAIRYAAYAEAVAGMEQDPETELRHLRDFCADITMLRRGDLSAGRLALEQQRLALLKVRTEAEKEKEFWEWVKRPEVQAKLYPNRDPQKVRRDVERMINRRLLGIRSPEEADEMADPAVVI